MKYNFAKTNGVETISELAKYESNVMMIQFLDDSIKRLTNKLAKLDESDPAEKLIAAGIRAEIEKAKTDRAALEAANEAARPAFEAGIATITADGNSRENAERILRLLAASDNRRLLKYVVDEKTAEKVLKDLFPIMDSIHIGNIGELGLYEGSSTSPREAKDKINAIIRELFHLPLESGITEKVKPKVNSTDLRMLHESYIKGLNSKVDKKTGAYTLEMRTSGTRFIEAICQVVTAKL